MYFCALEALNNVSKYADASSVQVSLGEENGMLGIRIRDNGRGFHTTETGYGTGLQGMSDRLDAIGGTLEIFERTRKRDDGDGKAPPGVRANDPPRETHEGRKTSWETERFMAEVDGDVSEPDSSPRQSALASP